MYAVLLTVLWMGGEPQFPAVVAEPAPPMVQRQVVAPAAPVHRRTRRCELYATLQAHSLQGSYDFRRYFDYPGDRPHYYPSSPCAGCLRPLTEEPIALPPIAEPGPEPVAAPTR